MNLSESQQDTITRFLQEHDMPSLYLSYTWKADHLDLFRLEEMISQAAMEYSLNMTHLIEVAEWGDLRNKKQISCPDPIRISLYQDGVPVFWLEKEPDNAVCILGCQIGGFGPTYCSKVLHFAVPEIFGAIDTRLVRVFGKGDDHFGGEYQLLDLHVIFRKGSGWHVPASQKGWPKEYGTWIQILNFIAHTLNSNEIQCPHPPQYIQSGRREVGTWLPADVETALFSYASHVLKGTGGANKQF